MASCCVSCHQLTFLLRKGPLFYLICSSLLVLLERICLEEHLLYFVNSLSHPEYGKMATRAFHLLSNYEEYRDVLIHAHVHTLLVTEILTLETEETTLKSALISLQQMGLMDGT
jgi:hypothetical protein